MSDAEIVPIRKEKIGMTLRGLELSSLDDLWRFCQIIAKTPFCPKTFSAETCLAAIQFGAEVGLTPMQALQNVAVINGKSALHTDAPLALCRRSPDWVPGVFKEWLEGEDEDMIAHCRVGRKHEETITRSFSWQDAVKAKLIGNDTYQKYPQRMLMFRARGWALRDMYGDVLKGLWSKEEAEDLGESNRTTRVELGGKEAFFKAEVIDVTPAKPEPPAKVAPQPGGEWTGDKLKKPRAVSKLKTPTPAARAEEVKLDRARAEEDEQFRATAAAQEDARQGRQEAAAAAKAAPGQDRETIVRLRRYAERVRAEGLRWQDFVKGDPHKMTDEQLEALMLRMENAITDAAFERQADREPGQDEPEGYRETGANG